MTDFRGLKGFALARESAFFKLEQEADIQRHRSRLVTQGRIEDIAGGYLMPRRQQTFTESARTFEVLAEVLQQQARLDDPTIAQRRTFLRKIKGQLPKLTDAELRLYRSSIYGVAAIGKAVPRVHLGRDKFYSQSFREGAFPVTWTPQQREAAQRAFMTGARSLAYGSLIGMASLAILVAAAARVFDISSSQELKSRVQENGAAFAMAAQEKLLPYRTSIQASLVPHRENPVDQTESEFRRKLASRFGPRNSQQMHIKETDTL